MEDFKNDSVVSLVINRALHLFDALTSIDKKCVARDISVDFPFSDMKRMLQKIHPDLAMTSICK